ncbi:MAG: tetratricopeptide repeat protein [Spirochaetaceae bacterium]|jgi:tetratricopeptide (TPR) repeat protein|nr:tetratricopeptide repeat protein [Spirochaetaceae bacterium]
MAKKRITGSVIILIVLAAALGGVFVYKKIAARNSLAAQIAALSPRGAPPQTIEDLRKAIALYETKIEEHLKDSQQTGIYWKILGSRLVDKKLHGEALEALERAAYYYPEDETVHYLIGISAGTLAKGEYFSPAEQEQHFRMAEQAYLQAIDIDERYGKALYGLSVLYVFEFGRPAEAVPYLERFLDIHKGDTDAMFVLAAARYMTEDYQGAVDMYDRILELTKDTNIRSQAESNRQQVMDEWYR